MKYIVNNYSDRILLARLCSFNIFDNSAVHISSKEALSDDYIVTLRVR
jgi:hypothetical protein